MELMPEAEEITFEEIARILDGSDEITSVSYMAQLGRTPASAMPKAFNVARVPGFRHEGIKDAASTMDYRWGLLRQGDEFWGILDLWWPNNQERRLKFNLHKSVGNFPAMLIEDSSNGIVEFGITATPVGEMPERITGIQIDADDETFRFVAQLVPEIRERFGGDPGHSP